MLFSLELEVFITYALSRVVNTFSSFSVDYLADWWINAITHTKYSFVKFWLYRYCRSIMYLHSHTLARSVGVHLQFTRRHVKLKATWGKLHTAKVKSESYDIHFTGWLTFIIGNYHIMSKNVCSYRFIPYTNNWHDVINF